MKKSSLVWLYNYFKRWYFYLWNYKTIKINIIKHIFGTQKNIEIDNLEEKKKTFPMKYNLKVIAINSLEKIIWKYKTINCTFGF